MYIEIMDGEAVVRTIIADEAFAEAKYPGAWRLAAIQDTSTTPTPAEIALQAINRLEREQLLSRPVRDFMLTAMKDKADELGLTEEQLIAKNTLYRRVKQFDEQIAALRAQL